VGAALKRDGQQEVVEMDWTTVDELVAKKALQKADASVDLMVPSAAALLDFLTADQ
jgi:hypothetical protein